MTKKLMWTIIVLAVAIISAVTALVIVLVSNFAYTRTNVTVSYVATDVECTVSARYGIMNMLIPDVNIHGLGGTFSYQNMYQADGTTSTVNITIDNVSGTLSPKSNINLNKDSSRVILEYKFVNNSYTSPILLELTSFPDNDIDGQANTGLDILYNTAYISESEMFLGYYDDVLQTSLGKVVVPAGQVKYVYIILTVEDLLINASFAGNIEWTMTRGNNPTIAGVDASSGILTMSNIYNGCTVTESDLNHSTVNVRVGDWYTDSSLTNKVNFPLTTNNTILYADYLKGNIAEGNLTYNNTSRSININAGTSLIVNAPAVDSYIPVRSTDTTLVIPDMFKLSDGKVMPIIALYGVYQFNNSYPGLLQSNTNIKALYLGNNIKVTSESYAYNSVLTTVYAGCDIREMYSFKDLASNTITPITNIYFKENTVSDWSDTAMGWYNGDVSEANMSNSTWVANDLNDNYTSQGAGFYRYQHKCSYNDYSNLQQQGLIQ